MNSERTMTLNLIQELNAPIEEHNLILTENQTKVINTKYLRTDPNPKFWLSNVARNIALAELIHKDKFLTKALEGIKYSIKEYDVYSKKEKVILFHKHISEYSDRCKNFKKFVENLENISETDPEAKQIVNEMHINFYNLMANFYFLPNSPTLMNASRDLQQLSACFVLPIEDSIEGWMKATSQTGIIHKSGGGTGFSASRIRPTGATVMTTKGIASGPLSPFKIINAMTDVIKQGGCVALDTRISTENGLIKISEIIPKMLAVNGWAKHQNNFIKVMTDSGQKLSDEVYNNGYVNVISIKTKHSYHVTATPEHRFRVIDENGDYVWKHLKDIKKNDWLVLQLDSYSENVDYQFPEFNYIPHFNAEEIILPAIPTVGLAEIIGYFIGDGCFSTGKHGTGRFILSFGDDELDVKNYIHILMFSIFGIKPCEQKKKDDNSTNSFYGRTILVRWFKNIGVDKDSALTVRIPELVFRTNKEFAKGFLRGLFTADGTISDEGYPSLSSTSEKLIDDSQQLLLSLGIPSSKSVDVERKDAYSDNPLFILRIITERGLETFRDEIGFLSEKKNSKLRYDKVSWEFNDIIPNQENKLKQIYNGPGRGCAKGKISKGANRCLYRDIQHYLPNVLSKRNLTHKRLKDLAEKHSEIKNSDLIWFLNNNQFYDQVESLNKGKTFTADISVPENNTYIANGFVSHNTRRGANMGILNYNHPNIKEFITAKNQKGELENFNISVALTKEFMKAVESNSEYDLINPHTNKSEGKANAKEIFDLMVNNAWKSGDPGFIVIDRINETNSNPTPHLGQIESTNPCGEQPLLPYEACNLGSINLSKFVKKLNNSSMIDYESLGRITQLAVRFLDNVIDINNYPLYDIEVMAKTNRRIGLGVMGWAEMLVQLELPYNSPESYKLAEEVMSFISDNALSASEELGRERGVFPNFQNSIYDENGNYFRGISSRVRNSARTTIAPTGTIAITAGLQGSGIEPFFAIVYVRYDSNGIDALKEGKTPPKEHTFYEVNPLFESVAKYNNYFGLTKELLWQKIVESHGSIQGIKEIPESIQKIFLTSHDLKPVEHVKVQAAFQKYTDNAVSKTINLKNEATPEDVRECYMLAYNLGCKGVTIYRDGSKSEQVLNLSKKEEKKEQKVETAKVKLVEGNMNELASYYRVETGQGPLHIHINYDPIKGPKQIFVNLTPMGTEVSGLAGALGILISKYFELGGDPVSIIKHLNSIKSDKPFGFGPKRIDSVAHGISVALRDHLVKTEKLKEVQVKIGDFSHGNINSATGVKENLYCPKCFSANVAIMGGCTEPTCFDCGYSKCS